MAGGAVVIGIGNPGRGDDAAGLAAAARLQRPGALPEGVAVRAQGGEPAALLEALAGAEAAWLIDACASGGPAGAVRRLDAAAGPLPLAPGAMSSHGLGLAEAIELARALGGLPPRCVVYAIEGAGFALGAPLSAAAEAGVAEVVARLRAEIAATAAGEGERHA